MADEVEEEVPAAVSDADRAVAEARPAKIVDLPVAHLGNVKGGAEVAGPGVGAA